MTGRRVGLVDRGNNKVESRNLEQRRAVSKKAPAGFCSNWRGEGIAVGREVKYNRQTEIRDYDNLNLRVVSPASTP